MPRNEANSPVSVHRCKKVLPRLGGGRQTEARASEAMRSDVRSTSSGITSPLQVAVSDAHLGLDA